MSEKRLKDYKGFSIWKYKDGKDEIFYTANDKSENIFDVNVKLSDLKKSIDNYIRFFVKAQSPFPRLCGEKHIDSSEKNG